MKNNNFNAQTVVTVVGAVIIFYVIFSGKTSAKILLPVLGAVCLAYGITGLLRARKAGRDEVIDYRPIALEMILGGLLLAIGLIEAFGVTMSQSFWNIALLIIILVAVIWAVTRHIKK